MKALTQFAAGKPVLVFDSSAREREVDFVVHASRVAPALVARMRSQAGGLICVAISQEIARALGLPFMADVLKNNPLTKDIVAEKMPYGDASAFSLSVNHRKTFTGITDRDRALTIKEFAKLCEKPSKKTFQKNFYSPGHVPILVARGLWQRRGHTELAVRLCELTGLPACAVVCEMLDSRTGKALSAANAKAYAHAHKTAFAEGKQFI